MNITKRLCIIALSLTFFSVTGLAAETETEESAVIQENDGSSGSHSFFEDVALKLQKTVHDFFREREEKSGIQRDPEKRQKALESVPGEIRSVLPKLIYYPVAVIIAVAVVFLALVYGFMRNLHPSWGWGGRAVWYFITILYLGFFSCLICYGLLYDPSRYVDAWLGGGIFYLPFAFSGGWFTLTPAEQVRDAIQDATADPDSGLFIMMARPIIRLVVACAIGGIALHLSFWWRSLYFLFSPLFYRNA